MYLTRRTTAIAIATAVTSGLALLGLTGPSANAVNANHGNQVVATTPRAGTPHIMNGTVMGITQVGSKIIAVGTFTSVSPSATFSNTADDLTRNRIFAFDANTGVIDPSFNPNLGGAANSVDSDGTSIYVGGAFSSVGGNTAIKRLVKLNSSGQVVSAFNSVPNAVVREVVVRAPRLYVGGGFTSLRSSGVTTNRGALAAVDSTTGATLASLNLPFTGVYDPDQTDPGSTNVKRFDVNAAGTRLVAIGNFSSVAGQTRAQIALIDTSGATATLSSWFTDRFNAARNNCAGVFDTFTRDVDFSPDGSYFAVTTTGAFAGGANSGTMCDTTSRWETNSTGNEPSWVDYTGGDTTYGVAVTGSAVYVGGHMRWQNNPFQGDQAGPGAVARSGIAALDPVNGLPLSWNPGRARGVGAQALFATDQGLWVGSDTNQIGGQQRGRIALMPLAGGSVVPDVPAATLPNDLFLAPQSGVALLRRPVGSTGAPTGAATTANTSMDWSTVRGAFLLNGTVYYGLTDGRLFKRTFNPTTGATGAQQTVNLHNDPDTGQAIPFAISNLTGMFYDTATHRIYYTVSGDNRLFYRYFTPESEIVGAQTFTADAGGISFSSAAGLTLASGRILYGSSDGALRTASFAGGRVTGAPSVVSSDGSWRFRAIFVRN